MSINSKKEYAKHLAFIKEYIQNTNVCKINNYYMSDGSSVSNTYKFEGISTKAIKNILKVLYTSYDAMEAVVCFFDALFNRTDTNKRYNKRYNNPKELIYDFNLHKTVKNWLKKVKSLDKNSNSGDVYLTSIISNDIKVVIKTYKVVDDDIKKDYKEDYQNLIREYFIGMYGINKLRNIVPNFMYTLGMFSCSKKEDKEVTLCESATSIYPFLAIEYVEGKPLNNLLEKKAITYEEWINIFIQLLIALEVAQRDIGFCHNDLHCGNVMAREVNEPYSYSVNLEQDTYTLKCNKYIGTIIDFGMSRVVFQNSEGDDVNVKNQDRYHSASGGIHEFVIHAGFDMFYFLVSSYIYCEFKEKLIHLFDFFNGVNPYQSSTHITEKEIINAQDDYSTSVFSTTLCTLTPKMFLDWIMKNKLHDPTILSKNKRETYSLQVKKDETLENYDKLFKVKTDTSLSNLLQCLKQLEYEKSYILSNYVSHILGMLKSPEKSVLDKRVKKVETKLIENDTFLLTQYINLPINPYYELPFSTPYSSKTISSEKEYKLRKHIITYFKSAHEEVIDTLYNRFESEYQSFLENNDLYTKLKPYLQFYYTIKELKLEHLYENFIDEFLISDQYVLYSQNIERFNRDERWIKSLVTEMRQFIKSMS